MNTKDEIRDGAMKIIANDIRNHNEERSQLFLTARKLNALSARLLEQEYYHSLPEARKTEGGFKEQLDRTRSKTKEALKQLLILLEVYDIRDGIQESVDSKLSKQASKIINGEYCPTLRREE